MSYKKKGKDILNLVHLKAGVPLGLKLAVGPLDNSYFWKFAPLPTHLTIS